MHRIATRLLLAVAIFISIIVAAISLKFALKGIESAWAVIAALLAVITSVVSSWNAQRVVELEEDKQLPYPYPYFDVKSRYGLILLRVTNFGQSAAHNIKIEFDNELLDHKGKPIEFISGKDGSNIPILLPQQSISKTVDGHVDFFKEKKVKNYTGTIKYENASGKKLKHPFIIDAEMYAETPTYDKEDLRTHYELQKIPKAIEDLSNMLKSLKLKV